VKSQSLRRLLELRLRIKLPHLRTMRHLLGPELLVVAGLYLKEAEVEAELLREEAVAHVADLPLLPLTALEVRRTQHCPFPQRSHLPGAPRNPRRILKRKMSPLLNNLLPLPRLLSLLLPQ
jgi:hypothetical protein